MDKTTGKSRTKILHCLQMLSATEMYSKRDWDRKCAIEYWIAAVSCDYVVLFILIKSRYLVFKQIDFWSISIICLLDASSVA